MWDRRESAGNRRPRITPDAWESNLRSVTFDSMARKIRRIAASTVEGKNLMRRRAMPPGMARGRVRVGST